MSKNSIEPYTRGYFTKVAKDTTYSRSHVSCVLRGKKKGSIDCMVELADAMGMKIEDVVKKIRLYKLRWLVVAISNFNDESFDEFLHNGELQSYDEAKQTSNVLNDKLPEDSDMYWAPKPEDYELYKFQP